jgi:hypothetical protein
MLVYVLNCIIFTHLSLSSCFYTLTKYLLKRIFKKKWELGACEVKKILGSMFLFLILISCILSCTKGTTPTHPVTATPTNMHVIYSPVATATQTGLFVEQADIVQTETSHGAGTASVTVKLRYGNVLGQTVSGATVTINSATLLETPAGTYKVTLSNIADGSTCNLAINSAAGNIISSVVAPNDSAITTTSTDGTSQSATAQMTFCQQFCTAACPIPQAVQVEVWRQTDNTTYLDETVTPTAGNNSNDQCWTINANVLPTTGQIYIRAYAINQQLITGANTGSALFRFLNSENMHYVNMVP